MQLLSPLALYGLLLLAIPVIVHLFRPRRVRQTPFSSLRWLHLTQQRLARRIQWHQILLFLLRAAFITLLVLALARPQWIGLGGAEPAERIIVLDVSRSMAYKPVEGATPMETARRVASELIARTPAGDRAAVLLADANVTVLSPLADDPTAVLAELEQVRAGHAGSDLSAALPIAEAMLATRREGARVQLYFITDAQQGAWRTADIEDFARRFDGKAEVNIIDVGVPSPRNAWIADARVAGDQLQVDVAAAGEPQSRTVQVTGAAPREVELRPGQVTSVSFTLRQRTGVAHIELNPKDALPDDDELDVLLDAGGAMRILLVTDDARQRAVHLLTALRVLDRTRRRLAIDVKAPAELFPADVDRCDVILLAGAGSVSHAAADALKQHVTAGGGLAIFGGPGAVTPPNVLPVSLETESRQAGESAAPIGGVDWDAPLFSGLLDPAVGDAALAHVKRYRRVTGDLATGHVLATVDGQHPLIVQWSIGDGRALLFATSADDAWWDLPRRSSFVPFVDRMLDVLGGASAPRVIEAGETITLHVDAPADGQTLTVIAPGGAEIQPALQPSGARTRLRLAEANEPGVYHIRYGDGDPQPAFVVRPARRDSLLDRGDADALAAAWSPMTVNMVSSESQRKALIAAQSRTSLWPLMMILASLVLLAEMYFAHKLCPRVQPVVTSPIVRHGPHMQTPPQHHAEAV